MLGTFLLAAGSTLAGSWLLDLVILTHFTGWFIFAVDGILKQPREVRQKITWRQPSDWIRRNLLGFWVFHGGLAAIFFLLIAVNHWVFAQADLSIGGHEMRNPLNLLFSSESLYFWTLAHLTLAFMPKPEIKSDDTPKLRRPEASRSTGAAMCGVKS